MVWIPKLQSSSISCSSRAPSTSGIADDRLRVAANRFYEFRVKVKHLDALLRNHLNDLKRSAESRAAVVQALVSVSQDSPVLELVGSQESESTSSYATAQDAREKKVQLERFEREIVSYVMDWERTVSTRVATELKHIQNLHHTWDRYHQKVESLKVSLSQKKSSKKKASELSDKISWNESKLRTAKKEYRRNLVAVTLFTEEVTDRGWKDLVPLLIRMIDFDVHATKTSAEMVSRLNHVREEMVDLGRRYEMDFEAIRTGRLRVLLEEDATDFVDPDELQDVETTVASMEGRSQQRRSPVSNKTSSGTSPLPQLSPCSDQDSQSLDVGEKKEEKNDTEEGKETKEVAEEAFDDASGAVPNYPSSIYLVNQMGGTSPIDDETTLTGVQDLVSV